MPLVSGKQRDLKIAVLDDNLKVAKYLADFDVIVAMRERTRFPAALIHALPNLKLIVTTGHRNNAIDLAACALAMALSKRMVQEDTNMKKRPVADRHDPNALRARLGFGGCRPSWSNKWREWLYGLKPSRPVH